MKKSWLSNSVGGPSGNAHDSSLLNDPLAHLARAALKSNQVKIGAKSFQLTGGTHFASIWVRDFCWAAQGLELAGDQQLVRDQLAIILKWQDPKTGSLPRVIEEIPTSLRIVSALFGFPRARPSEWKRAEYLGEHGTFAIDSGLLWILAHLRLEKSKCNITSVARMLSNYLEHWDGEFVYQQNYGDWQDSAKRRGPVFLTNLLLWRVLREIENLSLSSSILAAKEFPGTEAFKKSIQAQFFSKDAGLFRSMAQGPQISLDGNLLALSEGFISGDSAQELYLKLMSSPLWSSAVLPGRCTYPDYPQGDISWTTRIVGLRHYHDQFYWSWLMGLSLKTAAIMGDRGEADRIYRELLALIERHNGIFEIYENTEPEVATGGEASRRPATDAFLALKPVRRLFYKSEQPFSWGAALILEGVHAYRQM